MRAAFLDSASLAAVRSAVVLAAIPVLKAGNEAEAADLS